LLSQEQEDRIGALQCGRGIVALVSLIVMLIGRQHYGLGAMIFGLAAVASGVARGQSEPAWKVACTIMMLFFGFFSAVLLSGLLWLA
jgi:hypothetical protein